MTLDWYQLYTTNLILSGNDFAQVLLTTNQFAPDSNSRQMTLPMACGLDDNIGIVRDPNDGELYCVNSQTGNAGKRHVARHGHDG